MRAHACKSVGPICVCILTCVYAMHMFSACVCVCCCVGYLCEFKMVWPAFNMCHVFVVVVVFFVVFRKLSFVSV